MFRDIHSTEKTLDIPHLSFESFMWNEHLDVIIDHIRKDQYLQRERPYIVQWNKQGSLTCWTAWAHTCTNTRNRNWRIGTQTCTRCNAASTNPPLVLPNHRPANHGVAAVLAYTSRKPVGSSQKLPGRHWQPIWHQQKVLRSYSGLVG